MRRVRAGRLARAIPGGVREQVLAAIDRAGAEEGSRVLLLRVVEAPARDPYSQLGAEPVHSTSELADVGGTILAQVRLHSPPLSEVWSDRVVLVLRDPRGDIVSRCIEPSDAVPTSPARSTNQRGLETLRLPPGDVVGNEDGVASSPYEPAFLCRRVPALRDLLAAYGDTPERLLPHVLVPGIHTHEIDTFLVCLMGGEPELIQGEHAARCPRCARPMRFLLQLGDVLELPGDAPVVYVYGCDDHPSEVRTYVDMH